MDISYYPMITLSLRANCSRRFAFDEQGVISIAPEICPEYTSGNRAKVQLFNLKTDRESLVRIRTIICCGNGSAPEKFSGLFADLGKSEKQVEDRVSSAF